MNLAGFISLATLGESVNVDLWGYSKDGRSIRKAIEFLAPFAVGGKKWEHQVLTPVEPERLNRLIRLAGRKYTDKTFADLAARAAIKGASPCTAYFDQ